MRTEEPNSSGKTSMPDKPARSANSAPPKKEEKGFVTLLKKTGFKVWLAVMVIGGTLAFIVALFLV